MNQPSKHDVHWALTKVPQIIILFWVSKVVITAMGEATSDYMNQALGPAIAVPIMLIGLYVALKVQFRQDRYVAWTYWLVVVMIAVFGTSAADALHVGLGIPYEISTAFYMVVLAVIFITWYRSEKTLSIHSIHTRRRERLTGRRARHVRARHSGGRPDCNLVASGVLRVRHPVCAVDRRPSRRVVAVRVEPDLRVLVRVHPHPPAGCVVRGLA